MREIVSPLSGIRSPFGGRVDPYKAAGFRPTLVADMTRDYFRNTSRQSFDDLFTHSRLGNATMVDSDGLLKWAPHNLLSNSGDISAAFPTQTGVSVTEDTITAAAGAGHHRVAKTLGTAHDLGFSADFEAGTHSYVQVYDGSSVQNFATFDLSSGVVGASGTNTTAEIVSLGNGRYRCTVSYGAANLPNGNTHIALASDPAASWGSTFTADGTETIKAYIPHAYRSDLGGMAPVPVDARVAGSATYVPTTSTAKYLPRRHNHVYNGTAWVDAGTLIETEARTNLITESQALDGTAPWNDTGNIASLSVDATGPDGLTSAVTLTDSGATGTGTVHIGYPATVAASTAYTFSIFAKADQLSWVELYTLQFTSPANGGTYFDLSSGVVGTTAAGHTATIEAIGSGWYRCAITFTSDATDTSGNLRIRLADSDGDSTVDLDGTSSILIYGAQFEAASTPSSYIPTSGSTVTRAADTNGLTIDSSIVPWPTPKVIGDELVTNGDFATGDLTGWTTQSGGSVFTVSSGQLTISRSAVDPGYVYQVISTTAGSVYSVSFDVVDDGPIDLRIGTSPAGLQIASSGIKSSAGTYTLLFVATGATTHVSLVNTSYSVDATIDNISVKEINPLAVCIQMKGRATYADTGSFSPYFWRWYLDTTNYLQVALDHTGAKTGTPQFFQNAVGTLDQVGGGSYSPGINVPYNIASRHGSTFINGAADGTAFTADLTPTALPDLSGSDLQIGYDFMGNIEEVRLWVVDIGDTGLEAATS